MAEFVKTPKVRIVSGTPLEVDALVNTLLDDYVIQSINWCQGNDRVIVSVFLVHATEVRKAMIMMGGPPPSRPQ